MSPSRIKPEGDKDKPLCEILRDYAKCKEDLEAARAELAQGKAAATERNKAIMGELAALKGGTNTGTAGAKVIDLSGPDACANRGINLTQLCKETRATLAK